MLWTDKSAMGALSQAAALFHPYKGEWEVMLDARYVVGAY